MADIKLYYFDARGVAEVSRLVLAFAKQPYEDIRWSMDDWPKYKKESPFGQSPWIEYKGEKRSQSIGISIFLAQKFGLYGKTHLEALRIDEVVYLVRDVRLVWAQVDQEKNPTKKLTLADIYVYDLVYQLKKVRNYDALTKFPTLGSLKSKVEGNPDIAKQTTGELSSRGFPEA
ncbi:hypothetical protein C0Q70_17397 [Pomacea canaliculata]|uniref:GST N-terminal domain-containing protein n=1 Tax=Pomacea canaliculata TaxID=400727 RepID=A0A2T7NKB2_POMCA|nr:hypothetical protein C0Q70_17397 [Pomacea canaliculata]